MIMRDLWAFFPGMLRHPAFSARFFPFYAHRLRRRGRINPTLFAVSLFSLQRLFLSFAKYVFSFFNGKTYFLLRIEERYMPAVHFHALPTHISSSVPAILSILHRRASVLLSADDLLGASYAILRYGDDAKPNPPFCSAEAHSHICTMLPTLHSNEVLIK